jgi:hypothetical protein
MLFVRLSYVSYYILSIYKITNIIHIDKSNNISYYVTMNKETQTNQIQNLIITQDGEWINQPIEPTVVDVAREAVLNGLGHAIGAIQLETRMFVFDALHGTHYRLIRHELMAEKKRERFEASIGLIAINRK